MTAQAGADGAAPSLVVALGFPRSGTTPFSRLNDAHPRVSCSPETNLLGARGRLLRESGSDGPPFCVLSGLALAGIPTDDLLAELRQLVFRLHTPLAHGKPVSIEKSGFDVFYIDEIERLPAEHCRFINIVRRPIDVVASTKDLVDRTCHYMPELRDDLLRHESPCQTFAVAWVDRADALSTLARRHHGVRHALRYEDLVADSQTVPAGVTAFLDIPPMTAHQIGTALADPGWIGLGDKNVFERPAIDTTSVGRWGQALLPATAARLIPLLAPDLESHGYAVPGAGRAASPEDVLRQFGIAAHMRLSQRRTP